ncbi:hypothetical protein CDL12_19820 [Handroanthus impetiginosus]|uniref:Epidermal patterning factor-like protein n=1 Tax=Handroanthus impetiginosus TaxID=429701 RepID=A0A2G9GN24_9LAMI|nr:hypothetical protein CDL12_20770 [Handroanthus impetiginosus]PIN07603.1 hypothetical protein CDL12_19820 [Handroanthus impetiginosus]
MGTPQQHRLRRRRRVLSLFFATTTTVAFLFLASVPVLGFNPNQQSSNTVRKITEEEAAEQVMARRRLVGPGSSPPTCRSKCGRCAPCRPVHVPIQPGFSLPLEYYPEAWRCECGKKLFMP